MKNLTSSASIFFLLWVISICLSGNIALAQSSTLSADGIYVPRLTTAQRDAITSPTAGQMIFNTDDNCFNVYQKVDWQKLCGFDILANETWTRKADFKGTERTGAAGFSIGNKGYIGTGSSTADFWEYNTSTNSWTQKADFGGGARSNAVGFSIGNKGYIGTGSSSGTLKNDFWEYDFVADEWIQKADFAGSARHSSVGFSINNKGYIGTGRNTTSSLEKDFWEYDPASTANGTDRYGNPKGNWTLKNNFGGDARYAAVGFSIGNKGYIGTGHTGIAYKNDFWEYNPGNDLWIQKSDFGGSPRYGAIGFSIGSKGYLGTGYEGGTGYSKEFWEYDPASTANGTDIYGNPKGNWTKKNDFGRGQASYAVGFSIGSRGYVGSGFAGNGFWEYNPNGANLTQQGNNFNGNTQLVQTDATGKIPASVLSATITTQGNNFNGNIQLVQTDVTGKIPATVLPATTTTQGNTFNGNTQLVQTDATGKILAAVLPATTTTQGNTFNGNTQLVQTDATGKILPVVLPTTVTMQGNNFNGANQLTRLDASGFLGLDIASPKAPIHLTNLIANRKIILWQGQNLDNNHQFYGFGVNSNVFRYQVDAPTADHVFYAATSNAASSELFRIKGTGGACLNGNMVSTGASCTSDIRYKRDFSSIDNPLDKILKMNGFQYYWKTEQFKEKNFPDTRQIGFIAQEVEQLFPELVNTDEKGYKSVDYARLTPVLVEAIKELKKENDRINNENISIRTESASIRKDVEALKNLILQTQNGK